MNKELLEELIAKNYSVYQIAKEVSKSYTTIRYWLNKFQLQTNYFNFKDSEKKSLEYPKEVIERAASNANSYADIFRQLKIPATGGSYKWIKRLIKKFEVDISHWDKTKYKTTQIYKSLFPSKDLSSGYRLASDTLNSFLSFHNIPCQCNTCGLADWLNLPIRLDVDHINGNPLDNRLENLQYLCPNCHRQKTIVFDGKTFQRKKRD